MENLQNLSNELDNIKNRIKDNEYKINFQNKHFGLSKNF